MSKIRLFYRKENLKKIVIYLENYNIFTLIISGQLPTYFTGKIIMN